MKKFSKRIILLLVIASFLPGYFYSYTTTVYGMPAEQYYVLTPAQQHVVQVTYEKRHPSPLAVIGAAALVGTAVYVATDHHHHDNYVYINRRHGYRHHHTTNNIYINNQHYHGHHHR